MSTAELHPVVLHHVVNTLQWRTLRPLQQAAVAPVLAGEHCLLLAPTAGGKTEAATLPLLSRAQQERWSGLSMLYLCPLRALLNNLEPRLDAYAQWLGRRARVWHGDTSPNERRRIVADPPDLLLTTPESLESMLVSARVDPHVFLGGVRAVVVDEIHAFAGDDRGVHLRSLLGRLARIASQPIQRIGLSATVGNPDELLGWLTASAPGPRRVVAPEPDPASTGASEAAVTVDVVGSLDNAAVVLAAIHRGEKKLIFVDSRRDAERLATALDGRGLRSFVSHSSLSAAERRRTETAFAEASNCVIVATSTLELGIDIGDVDGVVQIGSPTTVASFLQRMGRSGRRAGAQRSMLFLCPDEDDLHVALGVLSLWREGFVEPVVPPPVPRHLLAQQLLALCLQEGRIGRNQWREWLADFEPEVLAGGDLVVDHLLDTGHLDRDEGMLFVGPQTDERYGVTYFRDLLSSFTSAPNFAVLHGRHQLGTVDPLVLTRRLAGPRRLLLAGRSWQVREIDWNRRRLYVEPSDVAGAAQWFSPPRPKSFALVDAMRRVVVGFRPLGVTLSERATRSLDLLRATHSPHTDGEGTVLVPRDGSWLSWWTWAGGRGNLTLAAALDEFDPGLVGDPARTSDTTLLISAQGGTPRLRAGLARLADRSAAFGRVPVDEAAVRGLKFAEMLPRAMAVDTLSRRMADVTTARVLVGRPLVVRQL